MSPPIPGHRDAKEEVGPLTRPGRRDDEHSESGGSPHLTMPGHRNDKADTSETLACSVTAALAFETPGLADAADSSTAAWASTPADSGKLSSATPADSGKAA